MFFSFPGTGPSRASILFFRGDNVAVPARNLDAAVSDRTRAIGGGGTGKTDEGASYVSRRSQEIGVRIALGARPRDSVAAVLRQGMTLTAAGIVAGLVGSFAATRMLRSLLSGVPVDDPTTFVTVPILFALIAAAACYLPARRASRLDPATVLREE